MSRYPFLCSLSAAAALLACGPLTGVWAQQSDAPAVKPAPVSVGMPQDAGPHDTAAAIEWWYFNAFLKTESGKEYAVVGSFFRTGLTPDRKGHYLIYSLTDLEAKSTVTASILDKSNVDLLRAYLPLMALQKPDDPRPMQLLGALQKGQLPAPHRQSEKATLQTGKRFEIAMAKSHFRQTSDDGRNWQAHLEDPKFAVDLDLAQAADRPPMLVGGEGKTGLNRPEDMFYLSLTHMDASGTLTVDGKTEKVTGVGWVDRQWGTSWIVQDNGWDWFGIHLDDNSDLIVYRVKDNATGKTLRAEATLLQADGTQVVDKNVTFTPSGVWTDPSTKITYPMQFVVKLGTVGHTLTITPAFPEQVIPVLGIGDAIWEGVVNVSGTGKSGSAITGRGYMELVGYKKAPEKPSPPGPLPQRGGGRGDRGAAVPATANTRSSGTLAPAGKAPSQRAIRP